jgi:hypothetical protein
MGCEEDGEKETRKAKADGKVDEEDEEDDRIEMVGRQSSE